MSQLATQPLALYNAQLADFFPLPLSSVEKFMFADGRPQYPMMCDMEMQLQGTLQREPFEQALAFAVARAPFFRSIIEIDKKRGPIWQLTDRMPTVDWDDYGVPSIDGYDGMVDLTKDPSLRIFVRTGSERTSILMHFHHAASDGVGAVAFVEDFLTAYHNAIPGTEYVEPRAWEPERLLNRCRSALENPGWRRGLYDMYCGIYGATNFFMQRPLPMIGHANPLPEDAQRKQTGMITQAVAPDATLALRKWTSEQKVTVNDLLLRDLFVTLREWMIDRGVDVGSRYLRILMPQNLRSRGDGSMPTTNDVGFAFLARRGSMISKPQQLLESLAPETAAIRQQNLSRHFIGGLEVVQALGLLDRMLNGSSCFATAVLTNFGNAWRRFQSKLPITDNGLVVGDMVYDGLTAVPPCRPHTSGVFCVCTTSDQISISLKHDPFHFTVDESQELLARFVQQITRSAGGPSANA
ncbi:hypothetical protein GC197_00405 [bacterium]|nr:hypothetical protein [bacterium]